MICSGFAAKMNDRPLSGKPDWYLYGSLWGVSGQAAFGVRFCPTNVRDRVVTRHFQVELERLARRVCAFSAPLK
jgi:hypothetical protein